jgi:peptide deformylase
MSNVYDIVRYPNPILFKTTSSFKKFSAAAELEDFLHESLLRSKGLAVAANQIGLDVRAFIMKVDNKTKLFINPHIQDLSLESIVLDEGCLSIPNVLWHVRRPVEVLIRSHDIHGNIFETELSGMEARVAQHEIDHLDGIALPDYLDDEMFNAFIEAYNSNIVNFASLLEIEEEVIVPNFL